MEVENEDKNFRVTNNNAIDMHVGKRVRLRRTLLGISQEQLGAALNITFQQVQKYERGANRISASRLWDISQILDASIGYFFDDMSSQTKLASPRKISRDAKKAPEDDFERDPMARRETLELVRSYYSISEPNVRKRLAELIKSVAGAINDE
jgi:transcriptional regulator with XRE-family HTH domain